MGAKNSEQFWAPNFMEYLLNVEIVLLNQSISHTQLQAPKYQKSHNKQQRLVLKIGRAENCNFVTDCKFLREIKGAQNSNYATKFSPDENFQLKFCSFWRKFSNKTKIFRQPKL